MVTEERKQKIISEAFATFGVSAWGVLYNVGLEIADNIILESQQSSITEVVQVKPEVCQNVIHHTCKWFDQYNGCMGCLVKKYEGKLSS